MLKTGFRRYAGLLVLLLAAAGCGKRGPVPLRGTVKLDGRPLAHATVYFIAQTPGGRDALGSTNAEGVFRLSTFESDDGALPGKYKVTVRAATEADPAFAAATPAEAMQAASMGKKLSRPAVNIPPRYSQPGQTVLVQEVPARGDVVFELQSK
jgi:hypothetical protein